MTPVGLQQHCELGQRQLMEMEYLQAEATLSTAEHEAWTARDWNSLARLYLPLQEARRQRRQRCGEGVICLDLVAESARDVVDGRRVVENFPHGQLLVAGWASIAPAERVRTLQAENDLYVETFLAAVYPAADGGRFVAIIPQPDQSLPPADVQERDQLLRLLPAGSIVLSVEELPQGSRRGDTETYADVMAMWEQLHTPFLNSADAEPDAIRRMQAYRRTIQVDYACELAHQKLAAVARQMSRGGNAP